MNILWKWHWPSTHQLHDCIEKRIHRVTSFSISAIICILTEDSLTMPVFICDFLNYEYFFMLRSILLPGNAFRENTASVTLLVCIFEFSNFHIDFLPNLYTYHIIYTSNTFKTFIGLMIIKYFDLYIQYILLIHSRFTVS